MVHAPSSYLLELGPAVHDIKLHYDFCVKAGFCRGGGKLPHLTHLYHYLSVHQFAFPLFQSLRAQSLRTSAPAYSSISWLAGTPE